MKQQFWLENSVAGFASTDLPLGQIEQHPLTMPGGIEDRAILEGHLRGHQVPPVAGLSEVKRLELLVEGLEKVHPGAARHFEGGKPSLGQTIAGPVAGSPGSGRDKCRVGCQC